MDDKTVVTEEKKAEGTTAEVKKKKGFWDKFLSFLAMGGFMLILILGVAIVIAVSILFKCK